MLKLVGAMVICLCGYLAGYIKAADMGKRVRTLTAVCRCVQTLERCIVFEKKPLKSAFSELADTAYIGKAFSDTAQNMRESGVWEAWKRAVSEYMPRLTEDERDAVCFLCRGMGTMDSDGEKKHLEAAERLLENRLEAARAEYEEKSGLYKKFGVLAAVFVSLIML